MRNRLLLCLLVLVASCSSHQAPSLASGAKGQPRLVLTAVPRQGFAPLHISFNVQLQDVDANDKNFHCLREEWDFGDGAVSSEQPNCEPFTKDMKISTQWFAEHLFDDAGNYTIRFTLGENKMRSNQISVLVLEHDIHN